jgi:hypothetical protein
MTNHSARAIVVGLATMLIAGAILLAGVDRLEARCHYQYTKPCPKVRDHRTKPIVRDHRTKPIVRDHRTKERQEGVGRPGRR